jgi:hypothetical protein
VTPSVPARPGLSTTAETQAAGYRRDADGNSEESSTGLTARGAATDASAQPLGGVQAVVRVGHVSAPGQLVARKVASLRAVAVVTGSRRSW